MRGSSHFEQSLGVKPSLSRLWYTRHVCSMSLFDAPYTDNIRRDWEMGRFSTQHYMLRRRTLHPNLGSGLSLARILIVPEQQSTRTFASIHPSSSPTGTFFCDKRGNLRRVRASLVVESAVQANQHRNQPKCLATGYVL
jgi:hypothetical protein